MASGGVPVSDEIDFVLASASPRRRDLCQEKGYRFRVEVSEVAEPSTLPFGTPEAYATHTAWLKASSVAARVPECVVGADTVVAADDGDIIGKPLDRADAERILRTLMGTRHRVITGICLALPDLRVCLVDHVTTTVEMRPLTDDDFRAYLDTGLWMGKAGAYGIQDKEDPFVASIDGSFSNVVGLPMERLDELLAIVMRLRQSAG